MGIVKRVAKNTSLILGADIFGKLMRLLFFRYAAVYLGVSDFGVLTFALSFSVILGVIMSMGLRRFATREIARRKDKANQYFGTILLLKIPIGIFSFIIASAIILSSRFSTITRYTLIWILISTFIGIMRDEMYAVAQAFERMEFESLGKIIDSILLLGGGFILISMKKNVAYFGGLYFAVSFILYVYILFVVLKLFARPDFTVQKGFIKWTLKESIPFGLSSLFYAIYFYIDSVMLSYMKGSISVGFYNAAYKLVFVLIFIPSAYLRATFPVISRFYIDAKSALSKIYRINLKYFLILAALVSISIFCYAESIIKIVYGTKYWQSIPALKVLGIAIAFSFLAYNASNTLDAMNKQRINFFVTMGLMFLNVILNFIFIPRLDFIGASLTTLTTEFVSFLLLSIIIQKVGHLHIDFVSTIKILLSIGVSIGAIYFHFKAYAVFIFIILLFALRVFGKEDIMLLKKILKTKP